MTQYLPTCRGSNEETLTQYDMKHTEMTGLIKFDFLGLKTVITSYSIHYTKLYDTPPSTWKDTRP